MTTDATSLDFATAARTLARTARALGLVAPTFRSPPRVAGVDRTIRGAEGRWVTVSVRIADRPLGAIIADMVEGIVVANRLAGPSATRARTVLWEAVSAMGDWRSIAA